MKRLVLLILTAMLLTGCASELETVRGVDVSSLKAQLESGAVYCDFEGKTLDGPGFFRFLREQGVNWVRVRLWNDPYDSQGKGYGGGNCDLDTALSLGKWATEAGLQVFLDFHYSDFWADPQKQQPPKAWAGMALEEKTAALEAFTRESLRALREEGVDVGMVQLGNEINGGICGETDPEAICTLLKAGARAVEQTDPEILRAVHFTDPQKGLSWAGQMLEDHGVDYEVFAVSYYPYWHGTPEALAQTLTALSETYDRQVLVAETAWPHTLSEGDGHPNTIAADPEGQWPCTPEGQRQALEQVFACVRQAGRKGMGLFYWEPAWTPVPRETWDTFGSGWASSYSGSYSSDAGAWHGGCSWENQALFDFEGRPLEGWKAFCQTNGPE